MIPVDGDTMRAIAPHLTVTRAARQASIIDGVGGALADRLASFDINTRLRIAHFLAQTCHESDGFSTTEEYASGAAYEGRPVRTDQGRWDLKKSSQIKNLDCLLAMMV